MELVDFTPRQYQTDIVRTCLDSNTLVVIPTGIGKTFIALLLAYERLKKYPDSKVLITAPTKPLCNQHVQTFMKHTDLKDQVVLFTGSTQSSKRADLLDSGRIIIATPQTIESDLINNRISLNNFSMLCLDEAHRSRMRYANTLVAKKFIEQSPYPRILALTASPGSSKERIDEIRENLFIEAVEVKTEEDEDVKAHIKEKEIIWEYIELPEVYKDIARRIKKVYLEHVERLRSFGLTKPAGVVNKFDLLKMQTYFQNQIRQNNPSAFGGISLVAQIIKMEHAITLIETQSPRCLQKYFNKLKIEETKAAKAIMKLSEIQKAIELTDRMIENKVPNPKMLQLKRIITSELSVNPSSKIIVFANYRDMVSEITDELKLDGIKAERFVGQADKADKGLKQSEQVEILKNFKEGKFNILVASSVAEEGIDIPEVAAVVFYEMIPSELRRVQRSGRTGRTKPGKVIFLLAKKTRDEAFYWSSLRKEKRMKNILRNLKNNDERQSRLG